jgi:hypothetical protein
MLIYKRFFGEFVINIKLVILFLKIEQIVLLKTLNIVGEKRILVSSVPFISLQNDVEPG